MNYYFLRFYTALAISHWLEPKPYQGRRQPKKFRKKERNRPGRSR
jgi:hypothetical protein